MIRFMLPSVSMTAALILSFPAQAAGSLTRTFVSSAGSDSNPCTITQPCATFAHAYIVTAASGIIAALDPGKYGPISITGPITINGNGWGAITVPFAGTGINIDANSGDSIVLTGLTIDGAGNSSSDGIVFSAAGSLTVDNCVVQNLGNNGAGIQFQPNGGQFNFVISNTTISNNTGSIGIDYNPGASVSTNGLIQHVKVLGNNFGISMGTFTTTGPTNITISDSTVSNNSNVGIVADGATGSLKLTIDNIIVSNNGAGIQAKDNAQILLGRSVITSNLNYGIDNETSSFFTFKDNKINFNGNANTIEGNALTDLSFQ
jgi:hypothetical protein